VRTWTSKKDSTKSGVVLEVIWSIEDQGVKDTLGRDKVTVKQGVMLDMTPDGSGLDMGKGKNVSLGRLREALNMNQPGQRFRIHNAAGQHGQGQCQAQGRR
jgi:hypothetical protein